MKFITFDIEEKRIKNTISLDNPKKKSKLNGIETLEFTTLDDHLKKYYRLVYKNKKGKYKEYIIASVELIHTNEGIEYSIYAEESIVETRGDFIEDKRNLNSTYASCGTKAFENTRWRLISESSPERHNLNFYRQSVFQSLSDILDKFNCEFETEVKMSGSKITDRIIYLRNRIGQDLGKRFAWSKDLEEIYRRVNEEDIITALYGFGKGEAIGDGYGRRITFADINNGKAYVENTDARDKYGYINSDGTKRHRFDKREYDTDDVNELIELTRIDLENLSTPNITYTAKVIDLQSLGIDLEGVDIGDSVVIRDKEADITLDARVIELDEDLDNIQETTIVLGNYSPVLGSKIKEMDKSLSQLKSKESLYDRIANLDPDDVVFIDEVIDNLNKEFNAGTSNIFFDENRGLVITDKKDESLSNWIMELGSQGFRIANSKNSDGTWDFRTFGTGDGFVADAGIFHEIIGKNYYVNLETGELDIGGIFKVDSSGSGSLDPVLKEELRGEKGDPGEDAIIVSTSEPVDKTKLWRKSTDDTVFYMYVENEVEDEVEGEWVPIDSKLEDLVVSVQEEVRTHPDKWEGSINTNVQNILDNLTEFQSELSTINDELTGKANQEDVLNQPQIENIVNSILEEYPDLIKLNQHFSFDTTNGLQITATDSQGNPSDTSVNIKNDGMAILVEGQESAYFKQKETLTPNLNVEGSAYIGNHTMLGFNGYDTSGVYDEDKNFTAFAWSPRFKEV